MSRAGRCVLVTGASKGIGAACALRLAGGGWRVFAGVRSEADAAALVERAAGELEPVFLDVTDPDQVAAAARTVSARTGGRLDALVNNAGIAVAGPLEFLRPAEMRHQLEVNVVGQLAVFQALRDELRRSAGRVVMMGSVAGRSALPFVGAYAASKFALEAVSDALRLELRPAGIAVILIEPGRIDTPIWETSLRRAELNLDAAPPELDERYGRALDRLRRFIERGVGGVPAERVARVVQRALEARRPRARYMVGGSARVRLAVERLLPARARDALIARAAGLRPPRSPSER